MVLWNQRKMSTNHAIFKSRADTFYRRSGFIQMFSRAYIRCFFALILRKIRLKLIRRDRDIVDRSYQARCCPDEILMSLIVCVELWYTWAQSAASPKLFVTGNDLKYKEKPMQGYTYYVMGQACVAAGFRGQKILSRMLDKHRELYSDRYELIVTSISSKNPRSLRAHISAGFTTLHLFYDPMSGSSWYFLLWDWRVDRSS